MFIADISGTDHTLELLMYKRIITTQNLLNEYTQKDKMKGLEAKEPFLQFERS